MSDFDKEAEREKLREKYEQDEKRRKTTEQMSELLLKGATMTNAHCGDCGDPIFRYDGQEFCPTCQKPIDRGDRGGADAEGGADDDAETTESGDRPAANGDARPDNIEVTSPSDDATVQFGSDEATESSRSGADQSAADQAREAIADRSADEPQEATDQGLGRDKTVQQVPSADPTAPVDADQGPSRSGPQSADAGVGEPTGTPSSDTVGQHLSQAQVVLAQTVERHARLAAAAETPRQTREHLETAREAAETLEAAGY